MTKYLILILLSSCTTLSKINFVQRKSTSTVTLDGSKSFDPDGVIVSFNWQLISGIKSKVDILYPDSVIAKAVISNKGIYVFRLTGIDNEGATGTSVVTKIVK